MIKTLRSNIILGFKELTEHYDLLKKPPKVASEAKDALEYFRKVRNSSPFRDPAHS